MVRIKQEEPELLPTKEQIANLRRPTKREDLALNVEHDHSMREIAIRVALESGISLGALRGASRAKHLIEPRHRAMYLCYELGRSFTHIGKFFGGRDHTSIVYAVHKMRSRLAQ